MLVRTRYIRSLMAQLTAVLRLISEKWKSWQWLASLQMRYTPLLGSWPVSMCQISNFQFYQYWGRDRERESIETLSVVPARVRDTRSVANHGGYRARNVLICETFGEGSKPVVSRRRGVGVPVVLDEVDRVADVVDHDIPPVHVSQVAGGGELPLKAAADEGIVNNGVLERVISTGAGRARYGQAVRSVGLDVSDCDVERRRRDDDTVIAVVQFKPIDEDVTARQVDAV